jgi:hypothetical protein
MVQFPLEDRFTKLLSPSLGVNRMWIKRNDCAPKKWNLLNFFQYMSEKGIFWRIKTQVWSFSRPILSFLHLLFPHTKFIKTISQQHILAMGPCPFFYPSTSFVSPTTNMLDRVNWLMHAFKYGFGGPRTPWSLSHLKKKKSLVDLERVEQPITDFTRSWDDFKVPGVNNP